MRITPASNAERRLVLVGGGHSHVVVLRALAMQPEPGLEIVLVAKELDAPYSGMLPGYVAGHYTLDECHIDLVRLAHFLGARLIHGEVDGIDLARRRVSIRGRPPLAYDLLSIDTGITPSVDDIAGAARHAILVKPVSTFAPRWLDLEARALAPQGPRKLTVIGTGAAGFEILLAMRHRLRTEAPRHGLSADDFSFALIGSGGLLRTHNARAASMATDAIVAAGITLVTNDKAVAVEADHIVLASGRKVASDATLVTTKAAPPAWFADTGLALDERGFLAVEPTLQVVGQSDIFAVGDCATVLAHPREKAGVFAVRQGPPLTENLRLRSRGLQAKPFVPQRQFLTLLSCGDTTAIAARGSLAASGRWAWWLKDRIDRKFMQRFQDLPAPAMPANPADDPMLCSGCAAKIGPATLERALARYDALDALDTDQASSAKSSVAGPSRRPPIRNLAPRDDAAVLDLGPGPLRLESIDHFPALWPEPYVLGEIVAAHAVNDVLAKGGAVDHALALVGLPTAASHLQEDDLFQLLAGIRAVLEPSGATLVGGHSTRAETLAAGLFVSGTVERDRLLLKSGLRHGDALVLTKPLGTGIVFAGWMRRMTRARELSATLGGMRRSSAEAAAILVQYGVTAMTDVTGFGLAGHTLEMLEASNATARISLAACPLYDGVDRLIEAGVQSSLLAENMALADRLTIAPGVDRARALAILFDPQTSGGLLAALPQAAAAPALAALHKAGIAAAVVGSVARRDRPDAVSPRLVVEADTAQPAPRHGPTAPSPTNATHAAIKTS